MNYETLLDLPYLGMCFNESMRMDMPITMSSTYCLTEPQQIKGYYFDTDVELDFKYNDLAMDQTEWQEPTKFIPERFDPTSSYYLTPAGKRRHPFSYLPFSSGKRSCLGKTFADFANKIMIIFILSKFDIEFVDKKYYKYKPI